MLNKKSVAKFSFIFSLALSGIMPNGAGAENICSKIALSTAQQQKFSEIQSWLDHLNAEKGTFSQTDQNGKYSSGKFALQRPDKMRFDYHGKDGIHIIGNDGKIAYTDPSVGQITFIPMDKTPLGLLFGKTYGWDSICLHHFSETSNMTMLTLAQKANPSQGNITLKFTRNPLQLAGWKIEDMQGNITEIILDRIKPVKNFPENYFRLPKEE